MWLRRRTVPLLVAVLAVGCGGEDADDRGSDEEGPVEAGAVAVWTLPPGTTLDAGTTSFRALVSRLDCAGGETGEVLAPEIREEAARVVVTFQVAPLPDGAYSCQGNKEVAYEVTLDDPLGDRALFDGQCLGAAPATGTSFCEPDGTRHPAGR